MTKLVPFSESKQVPAHITAFFGEEGNIGPKNTINQLSFRGKVWRTVLDGVETVLTKDDEPISTVHVVVLDHNKSRSRAYYEGAYEAGKSQPPACWSMDGETPDESVKEPRAKTCATCEFSKKGSKITPNGKETTACSVFKRLAVVPLGATDFPPLLLRLAQTSMWDKNNEENEAKGFYAWDQYLDMLRARGCNHTAMVATKIKFDSRLEYPKLIFGASRWLTDEELEIYGPMTKDERIAALLQASEAAAAARKTGDEKAGESKDEEEEVVAPVKPSKKPPKVEDDDDAPPPPTKKAKVETTPMEEVKARVPARKKVEESAAPAKKGKGVDALVDEWDD
jgi:hypothetical protein